MTIKIEHNDQLVYNRFSIRVSKIELTEKLQFLRNDTYLFFIIKSSLNTLEKNKKSLKNFHMLIISSFLVMHNIFKVAMILHVVRCVIMSSG